MSKKRNVREEFAKSNERTNERTTLIKTNLLRSRQAGNDGTGTETQTGFGWGSKRNRGAGRRRQGKRQWRFGRRSLVVVHGRQRRATKGRRGRRERRCASKTTTRDTTTSTGTVSSKISSNYAAGVVFQKGVLHRLFPTFGRLGGAAELVHAAKATRNTTATTAATRRVLGGTKPKVGRRRNSWSGGKGKARHGIVLLPTSVLFVV